MPQELKFELSVFEQLLRTELHPSNIEKTLEKTSIHELKMRIETEALRTCHALRDVTCIDVSEVHLERYVGTHAQAAIKILDQVYAFIKPEAAPAFEEMKKCEGCMEAYYALKVGLKMVLNYIEKELSRYFNLQQLVPDSFRIASARQLQSDKNLLWAKLKSKEINPLLQELILAFVSEHAEKECCTYLEQKYVKLLMESLLKILKSNKPKDWNRKVIVELIYLNFNKGSFFTWCRSFIAEEIDGYKTVKEQLVRFNWYLKEIEPMPSKPNVFYKMGRPGMKDLLNGYIGAELIYLAEWHKEHPAMAASFKERVERFDFKLPLNLTVDQLALFVELFIRTGVFPVEKGQMMKTMEFFAENVSTIGTHSMSAQSLNNKRKPDARTVAWMGDMLGKMFGQLDVLGE